MEKFTSTKKQQDLYPGTPPIHIKTFMQPTQPGQEIPTRVQSKPQESQQPQTVSKSFQSKIMDQTSNPNRYTHIHTYIPPRTQNQNPEAKNFKTKPNFTDPPKTLKTT